MRGLARALCLTLVLVAPSALAQDTQPKSNAAHKSWQELVDTAPEGIIRFDEAVPVGETGIEIKGLSIALDRKAKLEERITMRRLVISEISPLEKAEGPPERLKLRIEELVLTPYNSGLKKELFDALEATQVSANVTLDYFYRPDGGFLSVQDLSLDLPFLASASVTMDAAGVNLGRLMIEGEHALNSMVLRSATLTVQDRSMLARLIRSEARRDKVDFKAAQDEALREIAEELNWMEIRRGGRLWNLAEVVGGMIIDAGDTKGPLTIRLKPSSAVDLANLQKLGAAEDMARVLNLTASYAGSRAEYASTQSETPGRPDLTLKSDKTIYNVGEPVVVTYGGLPGNQRDWVTVVPLGTPADNWGEWTYTDGKASGTFKVEDLAPGAYEARVYLDWPSGGFDIARRWYFSVEP